MTTISRLLLIVFMPAGMFTQTKSFDIAGLLRPAGWSHAPSDAIVSPESGADGWQGSGQGLAPSAGGLDEYVFTPPPNWTAQQKRDGIVLLSPVYNNGERCQLNLFPAHPANQILAAEAIGLFRQIFRTDPLTSYPAPAPRMAHGWSPQGWEYFTMRKLVGGQEGEARTTGVTMLLAKVDTQLFTIIGTSKDFLWSACFGEMQGDQWPQFFAGLSFKSAQPSKLIDNGIRQRLAGTWISATANIGLSYMFMPDGRYQSTGATRYGNATRATPAFAGDGQYSFEGNNIILTSDNHRRSVMAFRLENVSKEPVNSWHDELCMADPGSKGEVCYRKQ